MPIFEGYGAFNNFKLVISLEGIFIPLKQHLLKSLKGFEPNLVTLSTGVNFSADDILMFFPSKHVLKFHANCLHWSQFA